MRHSDCGVPLQFVVDRRCFNNPVSTMNAYPRLANDTRRDDTQLFTRLDKCYYA